MYEVDDELPFTVILDGPTYGDTGQILRAFNGIYGYHVKNPNTT
jgi:hypothetical protein